MAAWYPAAVFTVMGESLLWRGMGAPKCGVDFCDSCGDCLECYSGDPCPDGEHRWVIYGEDSAEIKGIERRDVASGARS